METAKKKTGNTNVVGGFIAAFAFAACRAVVMHHPASIHDQLVDAVAQQSPALPKKLNDEVTLTAARVDGMIVINTYELSGDRDASLVTAADRNATQVRLTKDVCSDSMTRDLVAKGVTYRYEYKNKGKFIVSVDVSSCQPAQSTAAAIEASAAPAPVVDTTPIAVPVGMTDVGPLSYDYSIVGDLLIIHAKGSISLNEHVAFNKFRDTWANLPTGNIKRVMLSLDSNGGSVAGAMAMTEWVKQYKVETVVPNGAVCESACVMIWGAGAHKSAGEAAKIGVHRPTNMVAGASADDKASIEAEATGVMAKTLVDENAPPAVIGYLTITSGDDMHWLTYNDAVAWGATVLSKDGQPIVAAK